MTRAESLSAQIMRCSSELSALADALSSIGPAGTATDEWSPREVLLHLIGALRELPDQVRAVVSGARDMPAREQAGGAYVEDTGVISASHALDVLLDQLNAVDAFVSGLSDDELSAQVRVAVEGAQHDVPIGLVVRHMVADHVDEHIIQLREAIGAQGAVR